MSSDLLVFLPFFPRQVSIRDEQNVYRALMAPDHDSEIIEFSAMHVYHSVTLTAFLNACIPGRGDDLGENLKTLRARNLYYENLNDASKRQLQALFRLWPGLEYLAPERIVAPQNDEYMSSYSMNDLNDVVRGVLPDGTTRMTGLRLTMVAARKGAYKCGMSLQGFEAMVPTIFNVGFDGYQTVLLKVLSDFQEPNDNADDLSIRSQRDAVATATADFFCYWTSLFPVNFKSSLQEDMFVKN